MAVLFRIGWCCLVFFCAAFSPIAQAAFPAPLVITGYRIGQDGNPPYHATTTAACTAAAGNFTNGTGAINNTFTVPNGTQAAANCLVSDNEGPKQNYGIYYNAAPPSCPTGSTLSGGNCTCTSPLVQNIAGNACQSVDDRTCDDASLLDSTAFGSRDVQIPGKVGTGLVCMPTGGIPAGKGCSIAFTRDVSYQKADGEWISEGNYLRPRGGGSCTVATTPNPAPVPAPDACKGGQKGTVNGVDVCIPFPPKTPTESEKKKETVKPSPDGPVTQSSTSTTSCTVAGACTTTTTTTTSVNGGSPTTSTESTTQGKPEYCAANKDAAECGRIGDGRSGFGGTCKEGFIGEGDALAKATAEAVNKTNCLLDPGTDTDAVQASLRAGTFAEPLAVEAKNVGQFNQTNPFSSTVPGDQVFSSSRGNFTIPLGSASWLITGLGMLFVAVTLVWSTIFVVKGI